MSHDSERPDRQRRMSDKRFYATLVFALLVILTIADTIVRLAGKG